MEKRKRATKSASKIIAAVTQLLDERDSNEITITDVVQLAGITRPTFYSIFGDLPTAFAKAAGVRLSAALDGTSLLDTPEDEILDVIDRNMRVLMGRIETHKSFYANVLHGHAGRIVQYQVIELLAEGIRANVPLSAALKRGPVPFEQAIVAIAASVSWTMLDWFVADPQPSYEELTLVMRDLLYYSVYNGLGVAESALTTTPELETTI